MHILIAPNAFKNSLSAKDVAAAIASGLAASGFTGTWASCPIGDGGDGTAALLMGRLGGIRSMAVVHDPFEREIEAHFVLVDEGRTAIIELAEASGLRHFRPEELDPLRATSFGTGELIKAALDRGVQEIILCVGGSATVDGGTGILRALGVVFLDVAGRALVASPTAITGLASIDMSGVDARLSRIRLTVLCDVTNPLIGTRGAAAIFGPQKGASPAAVRSLDNALQRFSEIVFTQSGKDIAALPRGGAAGGVAAGLFGLLDATLVNGIDYFLSRIDFDAVVATADIVITGEGSIDEQTLDGKGPWGVALKARQHGAFVVGLAGQVPLQASAALRSGFDALIPIGHCAMSVAEAMSCTALNLRRAAMELGNILALRERVA